MTVSRKRSRWARLRCWLLGHQWEGTWQKDGPDFEQVAEWCPRCHAWRSLLPAAAAETKEST